MAISLLKIKVFKLFFLGCNRIVFLGLLQKFSWLGFSIHVSREVISSNIS